jgi:plasmid stabilization system protein ParE
VTGYSVQFTAVAERHSKTLDTWWRVNRPDASGLFIRELTDAALRLVEVPRIGLPYSSAGDPLRVRRLFLGRTSLHLYYTIEDDRRTITIRAIWHSARGSQPRLK